MASEEDRALENLLDIQIKEQKESLSAIDEALASDPSDPELLSVKFLLRIRSQVSRISKLLRFLTHSYPKIDCSIN